MNHPEEYKDACLELPKRDQDSLLGILRTEGGSDFDIDRLTPPDFEQSKIKTKESERLRDNPEKNFQGLLDTRREQPRKLEDSKVDVQGIVIPI